MPGLASLSGLAVGAILGYAGLVALPFLFVMLRWRTGGAGEPGTGLRAGVAYFRVLGSLVALTAASFLLYSWASERDHDEMRRVVSGIGIAAFGFWVLNLFLTLKLGESSASAQVGRIFGGFAMIISGLMLFGSLLLLCIAMTQEGNSDEEIKMGLCFCAVWTASFFIRFAILDHGSDLT